MASYLRLLCQHTSVLTTIWRKSPLLSITYTHVRRCQFCREKCTTWKQQSDSISPKTCRVYLFPVFHGQRLFKLEVAGSGERFQAVEPGNGRQLACTLTRPWMVWQEHKCQPTWSLTALKSAATFFAMSSFWLSHGTNCVVSSFPGAVRLAASAKAGHVIPIGVDGGEGRDGR